MGTILKMFVSLVLGVCLGYLVFALVGVPDIISPIVVPGGHQGAINYVSAIPSGGTESLRRQYLGSSRHKPSFSSIEFSVTSDYQFSSWAFTSASGDVEAFALIAGPGNDGKTFLVEVCRSSWSSLAVYLAYGTVEEQTLVIFQQITSPPSEILGEPGYFSYEFIVQ